MSRYQKVLWGEGLFLKPQHFQRQDLYHETRLLELGRNAHPYLWGLRHLAIDADSLAAGILRLTRIHAVLPDGETIRAPEHEDLPDPINLAGLDIGEGLAIRLALPHLRDAGSNFTPPGQDPNTARRYVQGNEAAPDLYTRAVEFEVALLKKAARLVPGDAGTESYVQMPLVQLRMNGTGGYEVDPGFIPPCLTIRASDMLSMMLRRLLEMLQAKAAALYGYHREPSEHVIEFRAGDIASFWLLHTVNGSYAGLRHLYQHPDLHPERLFQSLLTLAGGLMTFSRSHSLADLPAYEHGNPGPAFLRLDRIIRDLLETVISSRYLTIPLAETKPSFFVGRLDSEKLVESAAFYLGVSADMPPQRLVEAVPQKLKLGSPDDVDKLVLSAMSGVRLMAAPQVPAAIPVRPGCYYFSVEPGGALYERMLQARSIAIYAPTVFQDLKLELYAVTK